MLGAAKRKAVEISPMLRRVAVARERARFEKGDHPILRAEDRHLLERTILPSLTGSVLFVGCDWYTARYSTLVPPDVEFWTIDARKDRARYGSDLHICDDLANIGHHAPVATFDTVVCNGILGFGTNDRESAERIFTACRRVLGPGGLLILGWDDMPSVESFRPETLRSLSLFDLERSLSTTAPDGREHLFDFYRLPL